MNERENTNREEKRYQRILEFLYETPNNQVNRFLIEGSYDPELEAAKPRLFAGFFPKPENPSGSELYIFRTDSAIGIEEYQKKILNLRVPDEVAIRIADNPTLKRALERVAAEKGSPTQALVFARQQFAPIDTAVLYSIRNVSARTGLEVIQNTLRRKLESGS